MDSGELPPPASQPDKGCCGPPPEPPSVQSCCSLLYAHLTRTPERPAAPSALGSVDTAVGDVPRVDTRLRAADRLRAWAVRWGVGRMRYAVQPGLYAVGRPTADSAVLLSANYKMSFDRLRSQLGGLDAWILVLDTRGINVWCAAGKGTFGTEEICARIEAARLAEVVSHRRLIAPQLGAPGTAAHEVKRRTGFRVVYGPVRAEDLPAFLAAGMQAAPEMRRVRFPLRDRLAVVPMELVLAAKVALLIAACLLLLAGLGSDGYSWTRATGEGVASALLFLGACIGGVLLTAALLPWLPGRALAIKGAVVGAAMAAALVGCAWYRGAPIGGGVSLAAWCVIIPVTASFLAMNFTGATTYTSLSGVRREMRAAVPIQAAGAVAGAVLWLMGRFV